MALKKRWLVVKKELLVPAGDILSFKAAVHAGADAIYVGGKRFGARKFANNFDNEELKEIVEYARLYGVKVYVTVNTMIYEKEMEDVLSYVKYLASIYVDAVIVQDIGLIRLIRQVLPNLEVHASTQAHNYTKENFDLLEELGVKRVVLARENSLDEICAIDTKLEKEVFIHGAICISYSGQCLFSSLVLNRSGNRGECAGMCRLSYSLEDNRGHVLEKDKYLLSPRELWTIPKFKNLMESDIVSFKIEGRMKSASYVYMVTKIYRTLMDKYERGEELVVDDEDIKKLKILFNREFTTGHLFSLEDEFMNTENPNHIGIHLGKVVDVNSKRIKILLDENMNQEDGIRFQENGRGMIVNFLYNEKGLLVSSAKAGECVFVDNKVGLTTLCEVLKTSDKKLDDELLNYTLKRIPVSLKVVLKKNEALYMELSDGLNTVSSSFGVIEGARNYCVTKEDVLKQVNRFQDTAYSLDDVEVIIDDGVFVPMGVLNQVRRDVIEKLNCERIRPKNEFVLQNFEDNDEGKVENPVKISCLVRNEEQLLTCIDLVDRVYVTEEKLYFQYKDKYTHLYLRVPRGKGVLSYCGERLLITEFSQVSLAKDNEVVSDYYLNVSNDSYLKYLKDKGVECSTVSVEAKLSDISSLSSNYLKEVIVYGKLELMLIKGNILQNGKKLVDRNKKRYPIVFQDNLTHIFFYQDELFLMDEVKEITKFACIRLEFFDEEKDNVIKTIKKYQDLVQK